MERDVVPFIVNGQPVRTGRSFPVINPATEERIAEVANADRASVEAALAAARDAFPGWAATPIAERRAIMDRCCAVLEREKERLVDLLVAETGKPYDTAAYGLSCLVGSLRFFSEEAQRVSQEVIPDPMGRFLHYLLRQPLGVVVGLLAWNYPLLNLGYKLGPVLASGCTAVIKPSRHTPLATLAAVELLAEAGVPAGVVNVITCDDHRVSNALLDSRIPSLITMIGSTEAGVEVMATAATSIKRFSLELGNAPRSSIGCDPPMPPSAVNPSSATPARCACNQPLLCPREGVEEFLSRPRSAPARSRSARKGPMPMMGPR